MHKLPRTPDHPDRIHQLLVDGGTGNPLPRASEPKPIELVYHQLQITFPAPGHPNFVYIDNFPNGSGRKTLSAAYTVDDFINDLQNGTQTVNHRLYNMLSDAPNIVIKNTGYVIVQLVGDPTIRFKPEWEAIDTAGDFSADPKYTNLVHYDTSWDAYDDESGSSPCYVILFGIEYVDVQTPFVNDLFNINLQIGELNGEPLYLQVDPALKNRGPHSFFGSTALKKPLRLRRSNSKD